MVQAHADDAGLLAFVDESHVRQELLDRKASLPLPLKEHLVLLLDRLHLDAAGSFAIIESSRAFVHLGTLLLVH